MPPTLLQSLLPNTSGVRQITARPIDALMWPFRFGQESDDAQKETKDKDAKDQDLKKQHTDEPTLFEKRVTAVRLLALVSEQARQAVSDNSADMDVLVLPVGPQFGNCARHGRILSSSLLSELAPRLKVLKPSSLSMLLEVSTNNPVLVRLVACNADPGPATTDALATRFSVHGNAVCSLPGNFLSSAS